MIYFPAPKWLYRWQLHREVNRLKAQASALHIKPKGGHLGQLLWQSNRFTALLLLYSLALYALSHFQTVSPPVTTVLIVAGGLCFAYVQFVMFLWSNRAHRVIKDGNFAQVNALIQIRYTELKAL